MELKIVADNTIDDSFGKMSQQTYFNIYRRKAIIDHLDFDTNGPHPIRIDICDDATLEQNTLYVSPNTKSLFYQDKDSITLNDFVKIVNDLEHKITEVPYDDFYHNTSVPSCEE
jgi:hypothetical protein